ncbi:prolyl oligopeptidase PreP (S9A serine peptidase family) [Bradyrhizobium sp. USDA 3686]|nr:prolyl oligopeptidase PreP (S9A serine peptidase family) [Bradyrhizobium canariense]
MRGRCGCGEVRLWRGGEPIECARVVFETTSHRMSAYCHVDFTAETPRVWFIDRLDFFNFDVWLGTEDGATVKLDLPSDIWLQIHRDWFVIKLRSAWTIGGVTHAPDTVLGISLSALLAGDRNLRWCSHQARAALCRVSSGPTASSFSPFSTSCGQCSRSARRQRRPGVARR